MNQFATESAMMAQARDEVASLADSLKHEQSALRASFQEFLGSGWTGAAADSFAEGWNGWSGGADQVLDGLHAVSRLLEQTRVAYDDQDDAVHETLDRLRSRLG